MTNEIDASEVISSDNGVDQSFSASENNSGNGEAMVPQSKVNEIVGSVKKSTYDKAYYDVLKKFESKNVVNNDVDIEERINSIVEQRLRQSKESEEHERQERLKQESWNKTVSSLQAKIQKAAEKYEDFEEVTKMDFSELGYLLKATDIVDNSGDVLYHLCKNPAKFREMARDLNLKDGHPVKNMALQDLQSLSISLKDNEVAKQKQLPRSPLSQIKPSNVGSDNGNPTLAELRKKYRV